MASHMKSTDERLESSRWLIVVAISTTYFLETGIAKGIGVLLPALLDQFPTQARVVGLVISLMFCFGNMISLLSKPLTRMFEARTIVMACGILSTVGLIIGSQAENISVLVVGMCLAGLLSTGETLALGLLSSYFTKYYNPAVNIVQSMLPLSIIFCAPLTQLFLNIYGWRGAMLLLGGLNLHFVVAGALLIPLHQLPKTSHNGGTYKYLERGDKEENGSFLNTCFKDIFDISLFKNVSYVVIFLAGTLEGYAANIWIVYLVSIAQSKGLPPYNAAVVAISSGIGGFVSRLLLAILQREMWYRQIFYISSLLMALSFAGMYFATSFLAFLVLGFLLGIGVATTGSQLYIGINNAVRKEQVVSAIAWMHVMNGFGYLASGYITGWLYVVTSSFNLSVIVGSAASISIVILLAAEDIWKILKPQS